MPQITLTSTDTVPKSGAVTGTVTCAANSIVVTGSGTLFLAEVKGSDWIYDTANGEIRQVEMVNSDTELVLTEGFTNAQASATVKVSKGDTRGITVEADGGAIATTDSEDNTGAIPSGSKLVLLPNTHKRVDPIILNFTAPTEAHCSITY